MVRGGVSLFTWGDQDVMELQRNMKYYNLLKLMPGPVPVHYYDVQKLFSIKFEDGISRRSLEYATDYLELPKNGIFTGHWQTPAILPGYSWRSMKHA